MKTKTKHDNAIYFFCLSLASFILFMFLHYTILVMVFVLCLFLTMTYRIEYLHDITMEVIGNGNKLQEDDAATSEGFCEYQTSEKQKGD
jgi:hypothetical protein